MSKTGITIKGGNVSRLGLLNRIMDSTEQLIQSANYYDGISEESLISITSVYKSMADAIAKIETNNQPIHIGDCNFTGLNTGIKVEQSPEENLEETTQEGIIEEDEDNYEKCEDCEYFSDEAPGCKDCKFKEYRGISLKE